MACEQLQKLVQRLSTRYCLVSNFEIEVSFSLVDRALMIQISWLLAIWCWRRPASARTIGACAWSPSPGKSTPLACADGLQRRRIPCPPTATLAEWQEVSGLKAGRDLQSGGTWVGADAHGRCAVVTNVRAPLAFSAGLSRGQLPLQFLGGTRDGCPARRRWPQVPPPTRPST